MDAGVGTGGGAMMHMARGGGVVSNNGVAGAAGASCVGVGGNASPYMGEQAVPPPYDLNTGPNSAPNMYPGNSMMDPARSNSHGKKIWLPSILLRLDLLNSLGDWRYSDTARVSFTIFTYLIYVSFNESRLIDISVYSFPFLNMAI